MTHDEAINAINHNMPTKGTYIILTEALELAIEALEKQIPKQPIPLVTLDGDVDFCNECESTLSPDDEYCHQCGTRIGWPE